MPAFSSFLGGKDWRRSTNRVRGEPLEKAYAITRAKNRGISQGEFQATILASILAFGIMPSRQWLGLCSSLKGIYPTHEPPCPVCGCETIQYNARLTHNVSFDRIMVVCPRCGILDDRPVDSPSVAVLFDSASGNIRIPQQSL